MRTIFSIVFLFNILLMPSASFAGRSQAPDTIPTAEIRDEIPLPQDRDLLHMSKEQLEPPAQGEKSYTPHSYDVLHYQIDIDIDIPGDTVRTATVLIDCRSQTDTLSTIDLQFYRMTVDSITVDGDSVSYTRNDDELLVELDSTVSQGDTFQVAVTYHGRPITGLFGSGLFITPTSTYTICAPDGAYKWFPCWDHPSDKATADVNVTVPTGYIVASNGTLLEVVSGGGGTTETYRWSENYPIATYLICLTVYPYATFSLWYLDEPDTMEIPIWVRPADSANAVVDFANLPEMISYYKDLFGPYPFIDEKYAIAWFPWSGAMEHQTCVSWGFSITGNQDWEHVVAHELSHMWWGDWVTYGDYGDVWLNEGFATYCEALWWEHLYGASGLQTYMEDMQQYYINWENHSGNRFPIYNPPPNFIYSPTTYEKAGCVLHMLRFVVGDSSFFDILRTYGSTYAYGNAVTADFHSVCEACTGQDLDWFFDQWIYDQGFPEYSLLWSAGGGGTKAHTLSVAVSQLQEDAPIFNMPMELEITTTAGATLDTLVVDQAQDFFRIVLADSVVDVQLDPYHWLLCEKEVTMVSDTTAPEAVADLAVILENGMKSTSGNLWLWWSPTSDDIGGVSYIIYRSTSAESLGDSLAGTIDTTYLDIGAAGDIFMNYYYTVLAVDWTGNKSAESNRVGEFDRSLSNGQ